MKKPVMEAKNAFRQALLDWFGKNAKDYPWRRTQDAYEVLVSEVMLQQTQIATVLGKGYYVRFLEMFPDVGALAAAEDEPLLKAWEGLGYYRRARMLRDTARAVLARHGGVFPDEIVALMDLPGIGRYTAGALRAFAFGKAAVLVDGNVSRVIARLMNSADAIDDTAGTKRVWAWADELADESEPRAYHAALMELGQQICRPGLPDCIHCPVAAYCAAEEPELLPVKSKKTAITEVDEHALWLRDGEGRILMHQETGKRRTGLWKLPMREADELAGFPLIHEQKYGITRYRVRLRVHDGNVADTLPDLRLGDAWVTVSEVAGLAMAAPFRRAFDRIIDDF